ncbi:MAG: type VI secretion system contractile sheath protein TssC [Bacteroidales bacterium]|nr:type VI secretion system contractile sheath protein TssC [Bacteroidales bacterium]
MERRFTLFIVLFLVIPTLTLHVNAQSEAADTAKKEWVKYNPDFRFNDGVYLNFDQVKNNDPIPKYKIISSVDYNNPQFFDAVATESAISYYDNLGIRQDVSMKSIWGYCKMVCYTSE